MSEIKIGPGEIPKLIEPIKKIDRTSSISNDRNPNQEQQNQQQKPKEEGKGDLIDVDA